MTIEERARRLHALHQEGTLVLPNCWDAGSAALLAAAGAAAVATTSSGISWALGAADGEQLRREEMIAAVARIARAVDVPVSADLEAGYGPDPADVAATIDAAIDAGAVGANLEDRLRTSEGPLFPLARHAERLAAARAAADRRGIRFVINARTDIYLARVGTEDEREQLVLERAEAFARAGADCLFVPGLVDLEAIARLVRRAPLPVSVMLSPGYSPSIKSLKEAGVRRISVGDAITRTAYDAARHAAARLLADDDEPLHSGISYADMQKLMTR